MGSGFCLCAGAASPTPRGAVKTAPYDAKDKGGGSGKAAGRACPAPTGWLCLCVGEDSISARRRVRRRKVYGSPCRGRRPRRPAERSKPLPMMQKINGRQRQGCGPGMPGPYRGIHDSHALASACATFSTSSSFRAEYPATTVSARQSLGRAR